MGRHSSPARRNLPVYVFAPLLAVGGVLSGAAAISLAGPGHDAGCTQTTHVRVSAPTEIAPTIRSVASGITVGTCTVYDVTERDAQTAGRDIAVGASDAPQIWVTDSPLIVERVNRTRKAHPLVAGPSVATSPITFGVPGQIADGSALRPEDKALLKAFTPQGGRISLAQVLATEGGKLPLRVADPETSSATLLGATAALAATGKDQQASLGLARTMVGASQSWSSDADLQLLAAHRDPKAVIWPASEQQLYALNKAFPDAHAAGFSFVEGNPMLDYRVVPVSTKDGAGAPPANTVAALQKALVSTDGQRALRDAGFRVGGTTGTRATVPGLTGAPVTATPLTLDQVETAVRVTDTVGLQMNLLTVMDVTGSMKDPAAGGLTRIQMATTAVQKAVSLFPTSTRFGLWAFADGINGPKNPTPYRQVLPIAPLSAKAGTVTQQQAALGALQQMQQNVGGATPLYDTILAAYKATVAAYDPRTTNSMVLVTDGRNDSNSTLDLKGLIAQLQAASDPKKPVKIILVGISQDADMPTLRAIAKATGGAAYNASDPATISDVVFDAIAQRITAATQL